ncbi:hypothetical protein HWV62_25446 [Athelia sp. TMB]|nr:hypothetical protein HWV62_25446 [Athelia sp. TMB]
MASQLPSPPETLSESLANSQSTLNSSTDDDLYSPPSRPSTPQRGRLDPRYPSSLGPGRVPLHRRGTSKTYERMEDLLREAGYKETRVFTPETERAEAEAEERRERNARLKSGVDAVVGFITGLVSRAPSVAAEGRVPVSEASGSGSRVPQIQQEYSPPPSPLANASKRLLNLPRSSMYPNSRPSSPSMSVESLNLSPRASPHRPLLSANATPRPLYHHHSDPYTHTQSPTRPSRLRPQPSSSNSAHALQTYAQASKAKLYLRHMASAPSIQPQSNMKPMSLQRHSSSRYAYNHNPKRGNRSASNRHTVALNDDDLHTERRGNGEGEEDPAPPLPKTWLESVARAVLFGGTGAHVATVAPNSPSRSPSQSHSRPGSRLEALRLSPGSSKSALSDHTNVPRRVKGHAPPFLCAQVASARAPSESRVSRTRVICKSAPGSRSGSRLRVPEHSDWGLHAVERERGRKSAKGRGKAVARKGKGKDNMPSLTSTHSHDDDGSWGRTDDMHALYTSGSSSEEDEGELDLARLLVPPKRQNSIRSLRKHLHTPSPRARILALGGGGSVSRRGRWQRDGDGDEEWQSVTRNARRGGGDQDHHHVDGIFFGAEGKVGARKRTGIPGG